jgi:hypothetical protein
VSFAKKRAHAEPRWLLRRPSVVPLGMVVRTVLMAIIAIGGAAWALARHYTHVNPPMLVPTTPPATPVTPAYDLDAGELPAPDLEPLPRR